MEILYEFIKLLETSPPFRDSNEILYKLLEKRMVIRNVLKSTVSGNWNPYKEISKIINNVLRQYGQANVVFHQNKESTNMLGVHKTPTDAIVIVISPWYLSDSIRKEDTWYKFCKEISTTFTHELVHRWQLSRSKNAKVNSNNNFKFYFDDQEEIAAWAHDIISDVGFELLQNVLRKNNLSNEFFDLLNQSSEYKAAIRYVDEIKNIKQHRKTLNRLHRAIADIVLNN